MRPIIFPPEGVVHHRTARASCRAGMMGEVQYLRPEPFRYNRLQGPVKGGLSDEELVSVDVEARVRVSYGLGGPTEGVLGLFPKELFHRHG